LVCSALSTNPVIKNIFFLNPVVTAYVAVSCFEKSAKIRAKMDFLQTHLFFVISVGKCQGQYIIEYFHHIKPKIVSYL
jgi:hypothetical protein